MWIDEKYLLYFDYINKLLIDIKKNNKEYYDDIEKKWGEWKKDYNNNIIVIKNDIDINRK